MAENFIEEFVNLAFIEPFQNAQCTSHIEAYHSDLWSQYLIKNTSHNIRSNVTEARVAVSIVNNNEGKRGFIDMLNNIEDMNSWKISKITADRLVKQAEETTKMIKKNYHKKKGVKFARISNQVQNTNSVVPGYKETPTEATD